jgi:hypothetical protein
MRFADGCDRRSFTKMMGLEESKASVSKPEYIFGPDNSRVAFVLSFPFVRHDLIEFPWLPAELSELIHAMTKERVHLDLDIVVDPGYPFVPSKIELKSVRASQEYENHLAGKIEAAVRDINCHAESGWSPLINIEKFGLMAVTEILGAV